MRSLPAAAFGRTAVHEVAGSHHGVQKPIPSVFVLHWLRICASRRLSAPCLNDCSGNRTGWRIPACPPGLPLLLTAKCQAANIAMLPPVKPGSEQKHEDRSRIACAGEGSLRQGCSNRSRSSIAALDSLPALRWASHPSIWEPEQGCTSTLQTLGGQAPYRYALDLTALDYWTLLRPLYSSSSHSQADFCSPSSTTAPWAPLKSF